MTCDSGTTDRHGNSRTTDRHGNSRTTDDADNGRIGTEYFWGNCDARAEPQGAARSSPKSFSVSIRRLSVFIRGSAVAVLAVTPLTAQVKPDSVRRDTLEAVVVRALRAPAAMPSAQHTVTRDAIGRTFVGQDAPLFLTRTPSMTSYSEAGGFSGYSYVRLRGIDQTRLNITLDGVPLNDPEDQVLYFSNVPDFLNSIQSVQIQRGVGPSTFGTASYAGSLNFQSVPLASTPRGGELDLTGGSFNTMRASAQYSTGVSEGGWAGYTRVSKQHTDGYRDHSGNDSQSAFAGGGWFGDRDALKFTGFAGVSGTRMAYLAASESDLAINRRVNPLTEAEGDRFHQEMASVQYTHAVAEGATFTATGYRNSAAGAFDVNVGSAPQSQGGGPIIDNFYLAHVWYGLLSAISIKRRNGSVDFGANVSDYHREHALAVRPDLTDREYTNVGFKQEQSAFAKAGWDAGELHLSAELQLRRAAFRYRPSPCKGICTAIGFGPLSTSWSFVNPKLSLAWHRRAQGGDDSPLTVFASFGRTSREPARGDLFAGADDLNAGNAADVLPLTRVRPEKVNDFEAGATWARGALTVTASVFDMEFHDEIAAIGRLSLTGSPLRQNVDASYRRGVELDGSWRASEGVSVSGNLTLMKARILSWTDAESGNTYTDVEPLMTPPAIGNAQAELRITHSLSLIPLVRYVDRAHLANDGNARLTTPPYWMVDAALAWRARRAEVRAQLFNALDANAFAGGYSDGSARYFYPIASRNVLVTTKFTF
jgi:iron complex outermembrane receptor protein